jgi:hypothetical protein
MIDVYMIDVYMIDVYISNNILINYKYIIVYIVYIN